MFGHDVCRAPANEGVPRKQEQRDVIEIANPGHEQIRNDINWGNRIEERQNHYALEVIGYAAIPE